MVHFRLDFLYLWLSKRRHLHREKVEKALKNDEVEEKEVFLPAVSEVEYLIRYHSW